MANCMNCNNAIEEGQEVVIRGKTKKDPNVTICSNCASVYDKAFEAETEDANVAGGILFGFLAALVSSLVWYGIVVLSEYQLGIIAVGVGWLVGKAVFIGAGRKRGRSLQLVSIVFTIVAMAFSEYLIMRYFIVQVLADQGYGSIPLLLPIADMFQIIVDAIKSDTGTLLFWAIAIWEAFTLTGQRKLKRVT